MNEQVGYIFLQKILIVKINLPDNKYVDQIYNCISRYKMISCVEQETNYVDVISAIFLGINMSR